MRKKWIAGIVCLAVLLFCAAACAEVVGGSCCLLYEFWDSFGSENLTWKLDLSTGTMRIEGTGGWGGYIDDPFCPGAPWAVSDNQYFSYVNLDGEKVRTRDYRASIKKVIISEGITNIAERAFEGCTNLTSVMIPSTVTSIDKKAFNGCTALLDVTMPLNLNRIGDCAFLDCKSLSSCNIPSSVKSIGSEAFRRTPALRNITAYGDIGDDAFRGSGLITVDVQNCSGIGERAFSVCVNLTTVKLCDGIPQIMAHTFAYDPLLSSVNLPDSVTAIAGEAFAECTSLKSITLPSQLTNIGDKAFYMSGLTSISIPDSVAIMGTNVFEECSNLASANISKNIGTIPQSTFLNCKSLLSVTIDQGITVIGDHAFQNCYRLLKVTLPNSLITIGEGAFMDCSELMQINIPGSILSFGSGAFAYCGKLTKVSIPEGIISIPEHTFYNCGLISVEIPVSITSIRNEAFEGNPLKTVKYSGTPEQWQAIVIDAGNTPLIDAYQAQLVVPTDINSVTAEKIKDQKYTGKAIKPAVSLSYEGEKLVKGTDYTVAYKNNKAIGKAKVIVTGKGKFTGKKTVTFCIIPKGTAISSLIAEKQMMAVKWKKDSTITGYQLEYSTKKNFSGSKKITVSKAATTHTTIKGLKSKKLYYFRIRTYKSVSGKVYYSAWSAIKSKKTK